jgi:hypothetical protein
LGARSNGKVKKGKDLRFSHWFSCSNGFKVEGKLSGKHLQISMSFNWKETHSGRGKNLRFIVHKGDRNMRHISRLAIFNEFSAEIEKLF